MIVKVLFKDNTTGKEYVMLFGNSYKRWQMQFSEYMRLCQKGGLRIGGDWITVLRAWKSNAKWIGWGGLKWCNEDEFQGELNREGCHDNEPDRLHPRQYADMEFKNMSMREIEKALE